MQIPESLYQIITLDEMVERIITETELEHSGLVLMNGHHKTHQLARAVLASGRASGLMYRPTNRSLVDPQRKIKVFLLTDVTSVRGLMVDYVIVDCWRDGWVLDVPEVALCLRRTVKS